MSELKDRADQVDSGPAKEALIEADRQITALKVVLSAVIRKCGMSGADLESAISTFGRGDPSFEGLDQATKTRVNQIAHALAGPIKTAD
jgi:DNA-binding phage protein